MLVPKLSIVLRDFSNKSISLRLIFIVKYSCLDIVPSIMVAIGLSVPVIIGHI